MTKKELKKQLNLIVDQAYEVDSQPSTLLILQEIAATLCSGPGIYILLDQHLSKDQVDSMRKEWKRAMCQQGNIMTVQIDKTFLRNEAQEERGQITEGTNRNGTSDTRGRDKGS